VILPFGFAALATKATKRVPTRRSSAERKADEPALDAYRAQLRAGAVEAPGVEPDAPQRPVEDLPKEALIGPEWVMGGCGRQVDGTAVCPQLRKCRVCPGSYALCQQRTSGRT
jgi:hypothetical protein